MAHDSKQVMRDCLNEAPRRRWLWPALAIPVVAVSLATGAAALAQNRPDEQRAPRLEALDPDNQDHYARLLAEVKQDEQRARSEIAEAERADSDEALADGLVRVAKRHRLAGESTRQAFVKAADRLRDPAQRSRVLRKLLAAAPITAETGAAVLKVAANTESDRDRLRVLMYFHEIKESDLVRGPLTAQYLDAAKGLSGSEDLSEALRGLLHPSELESAQVLRALELTRRLENDEDRLKVLREVTDHQTLTPPVMDAYREAMDRLKTVGARNTAMDRFETAKDQQGDYRHGHVVSTGPQSFAFRFETDDKKELKVQLKEMKAKMRQLRERMRRDLGEDINLEKFEVQVD